MASGTITSWDSGGQRSLAWCRLSDTKSQTQLSD